MSINHSETWINQLSFAKKLRHHPVWMSSKELSYHFQDVNLLEAIGLDIGKPPVREVSFLFYLPICQVRLLVPALSRDMKSLHMFQPSKYM